MTASFMRTRHAATLVGVALCLLLCAGCNALYFAETEKFSLTVEAKAMDATEPVAGNLGFKQRIVVVTPGKDPKADEQHPAPPDGTDPGVTRAEPQTQPAARAGDRDAIIAADRADQAGRDALSIASYFDLQKPKGSNATDQGTVIRSAFFTGQAAKAIARTGKTADALRQAIGGTFGPDRNSERINAWLDADDSRLKDLKAFLSRQKAPKVTDFIYEDRYAELRAQAIRDLNIP